MAFYRVVVDGSTLAGFEPSEVCVHLAALVRRDEALARRLLAGHATTVKAGLDEATAQRYVKALQAIGVASHLEQETLDIDVETISVTGTPPIKSPAQGNGNIATNMSRSLAFTDPTKASSPGVVSEVEKLAGTVNETIDSIVKILVWLFVFGCVTGVLLLVGFVNNFTLITAVVICICLAAVLRRRKKAKEAARKLQ